MACDLCKCVTEDLEQLLDVYRTKNVKMVCKPCARITNRKLNFFRFDMPKKRMRIWLDRTERKNRKC